jgi:hypothetical protein
MSRSALSERIRGRPPARFGNVGRHDLLNLDTVIELTPVSRATWLTDPPALRSLSIRSLVEVSVFFILGMSWIGSVDFTNSNSRDEAHPFILIAD